MKIESKLVALTVSSLSLIFSVLILVPLSIYQGVLLYKHIGATDLMWFIFWLYMGLSVGLNLLSQIIINIVKKLSKEIEDEEIE